MKLLTSHTLKTLKIMTLIMVASQLSVACVSLKNSNDRYNKLIADDCHGDATLGNSFVCQDGQWVNTTVSSDLVKISAAETSASN